jgi:AraC-like DNA-binding protein
VSRWISAIWTRQLIRGALGRGIDPAPLWALAGLDPADSDPMLRLADEAHLRIWSEVMRQLRDPAFPIEYAARMRIDDYDALGLACKTADNVGVALERIVRYLRIWTNSVELTLAYTNEGVRLCLARDGIHDVGYRAAMESALAETLNAVQRLAAKCFSAERVELMHSNDEIPLTRCREFFGVTPELRRDEYALVLARSVLDQPLALADRGLSQFLLQHLEQLAGATRVDAPFEERVIDAISRELPSGAPKIARVALYLGTSQRNLQRQLASIGKSFQELVTETRSTLALRLLAESSHSLGEIGFLLGFSEPSAFHRAFKRWTGQTPNDFRSASRASEPR